ncbi:protein phosphatase CheZ [Elioraea rosea]|uniref:protein phosphatase CheZ n=1 Tax=Elioraea rosea TaxID=2492390 RepID=UPI001181F310|nr:protein phosphatase CheZ [Elioraea rosea]
MDAALQDTLRAAVRAELEPLFADLRRFVDRRIAELSAELDAHVQLSDMSEEKLTRELHRVQETIANLVAVPAAQTRNSGVELEAVVEKTEEATNTILEAAEEIQALIDSGHADAEAAPVLAQKVNTIFEACSFQDVTGQRIRRAIQHLQQVEDVLAQLLPADEPRQAPKLEVNALISTLEGVRPAGTDLGQAAIDALMNG